MLTNTTLIETFTMLNEELNKISSRLAAIESSVHNIQKMQRIADNPYRVNHSSLTSKNLKYDFGYGVQFTAYEYLVLRITLSPKAHNKCQVPKVDEFVKHFTRTDKSGDIYLILACDFFEGADDICRRVLPLLGLDEICITKLHFQSNWSNLSLASNDVKLSLEKEK